MFSLLSVRCFFDLIEFCKACLESLSVEPVARQFKVLVGSGRSAAGLPPLFFDCVTVVCAVWVQNTVETWTANSEVAAILIPGSTSFY